MKKLSKILIMFICLLTIGFLVGCYETPNNPEDKGEPTVSKLATPENIRVVVDKETSTTFLYFDAVENASIYTAYLYINGKEVEYLGGDGVYIKQPLD